MISVIFVATYFYLITSLKCFIFESKKTIDNSKDEIWEEISTLDNDSNPIFPLSLSSFEELSNSFSEEQQVIRHNENNWRPVKREIVQLDENGMRIYNVGVLMASHLDSPFDLERCGPAVDLALKKINEEFLRPHNVTLNKVQAR